MVPASPLIDRTRVSASGVESQRMSTQTMTTPQKMSVPNVARRRSFHDGFVSVLT